MTLSEYTKKVNDLAKLHCERLNSIPNVFKAVHHDFCEEMMKYHYDQGQSVEEALEEIENDVGY